MKKKISITIEDKEAIKLAKLTGYSSLIISILLKKFFEKVTINHLWQAVGLDKPLDTREKIKRLEAFMKSIEIITPEKKDKVEKNIEKISPWGDFGIEKK